MRCGGILHAADLMEIFRRADVVRHFTEEEDRISCMFEIKGHFCVDVFQQAHHTDGRCRVDGSVGMLVIEAHVAPRHRGVEFQACFPHAADGMDELVVHFGVVGIPEVQAVGHPQWDSSAAYDISGSLAHGDHAPFIGVGVYIAAIAISGHGKRLPCSLDPYHRRIAGCVGGGIGGSHHAVILLVDPSFAGDVRYADQFQCYFTEVNRLGYVFLGEIPDFFKVSRFPVFPLIDRGTAAKHEAFSGEYGFFDAVHGKAKHTVIRHFSDFGTGQIPLFKDPQHFSLPAFLHNHQHAFLALAQQEFPCFHMLLAPGYFVEVYSHADPALCAGFGSGTDDACGSHVLHADQGIGGDDLEACFQKFLFLEWITDLNGRKILYAVCCDICGSERSTANAILSGGGPHDEDRVSLSQGRCADRLTDLHDADTHGIHQGVGMVA